MLPYLVRHYECRTSVFDTMSVEQACSTVIVSNILLSYNDDQPAVIKYIIYENNDNETLFEGDNCILFRSRIEYGKPRQWLENNVVDTVVEAVRKEEVRERNGTNWFFPCITYESYKEVSSFKVYYDDHVQKFAVTSDLEACEKIYIPIHHYGRRHFLLAVLKVPNQTCLWFDPMWSDEGYSLTDEEILPVLLEGLDNCVPGIKTKPFFPTFEEVIQKNAPRQPNGWDCGIYVMNFLRDLPDDNGKQSGKIVVNVTERDHEKFSQALRIECLLWVLFHEANKKRDGLLLEAKRLQNKLMDSDNNSDEKEARG
ncbi:putative ubiquitin-like-specific protease 1B [Manihot esculenta]|uniref:putative ubiquitin-like-specific protease 1B n=1 Tax=Manihot esculenta TaxID=3983 RepID=UPI000B5D8B19|nr:putative ubiquitin-like-specific protease 1B [Manihot esculenta]